jgi:hypothetical protein
MIGTRNLVMLGTRIRAADVPPRIPAAAILPLRLFLGGTNNYAGLHKLTAPQYFNPAAPRV